MVSATVPQVSNGNERSGPLTFTLFTLLSVCICLSTISPLPPTHSITSSVIRQQSSNYHDFQAEEQYDDGEDQQHQLVQEIHPDGEEDELDQYSNAVSSGDGMALDDGGVVTHMGEELDPDQLHHPQFMQQQQGGGGGQQQQYTQQQIAQYQQQQMLDEPPISIEER